MESKKENNHNLEENKKKFKMCLLYIQTKEIRKLYNEEIKNKPKKYYLVNKERLDKYKSINNYKYAEYYYNNYKDYKDYQDFKNKVYKYFQIDKNNFTEYEVSDNLNNCLEFSSKKKKK